MKPQFTNYGNPYLRSYAFGGAKLYANVRLPTLTFGRLMQPFYRASVIEQWVKSLEKPATLFALALRSKTIQQHIAATGVSLSLKNLILLQILRESHWCNLVFHPSLQCIITCVALPEALPEMSGSVGLIWITALLDCSTD
ncbi:hypothetical protein HJG54_17875 [Leptolyngbya sp. NK1-12]|uniref:Uncharacterized protein n=1 Tax=Leptolyngbya sp. NK1-12 TaxID=2547451 RepID=A0AA96WMZ9_9CYAN|nr:hypothetical protein HJG54_17875 [Leptolyngbya sp. NK1-12]